MDEETTSHERGRRTLAMRAGIAVLVIFLVAMVFGTVLWRRIDRFHVHLPGSSPGGTTYLIIGSDSREGIAPDEGLGDTSIHPGQRADIVLLVRVDHNGTRLISVPRDLLVLRDDQSLTRLALTLLDGPEAVVDALCRSIGVGVDRVIIVKFDGFRELVDAVGGVDVHFDAPVRDDYTGLDVEQPGIVHMDGTAALALVRSRHPLTPDASGEWQPMDVTGDVRSRQARLVLKDVAAKIDLAWWSPFSSIKQLWALTSALAVDDAANLFDLRHASGQLAAIGNADETELPVTVFGTGDIPTAQLLPEGRAVLDGFDRGTADNGCTTGLLAH